MMQVAVVLRRRADMMISTEAAMFWRYNNKPKFLLLGSVAMIGVVPCLGSNTASTIVLSYV
jgi:hypothetical protein